MKKKSYVLDTNIILNDVKSLYLLSDNGNNNIIIPETVLDELDLKKTGFEEINFQAREFGRLLESYATFKGTKDFKNIKITKYLVKNGNEFSIYIVSKEKYEYINDSSSHSITNDRRILEVAKDCIDVFNNVVFLSLDIMCRNRAISMGIRTETIRGKREEFNFEFIKEIDCDYFKETINGISIFEIDPEHKPENYSYILSLPSGEKAIGYVEKDCLFLIDEDKLTKQEVLPRNLEQKLFSSAILNQAYSIVVADSPAGSGKTLVALSSALRLVDDKSTKYDKIIYIRNSIESTDKGEDVGYLSGNDEKFKIYNYPLLDSLSFIARKQLDRNNQSDKTKTSKAVINQVLIERKVNELIKSYNIETMWVGEMRGRTISNAVVIVDEAQNISAKTGSLVFSRLDDNCKLICIGSNNQIDNPYINKYINTLSTLLVASKHKHPELNIFGCKLNKVIRGKITEFSERIFGSVKSA